MDDREIRAYIAGFFDGGGTIGIAKRKNKNGICLIPSLEVSNTIEEPIRLFNDYFGFGTVDRRKRRRKEYQDYYRWSTYGRWHVKKVLCDLKPYLTVKRNKAKEALEWISKTPYALRSAGTKWTQKEEEILRKNYGTLTKEELMSLLPRRSWDAIKSKGKLMGLHRKSIKIFFKNRKAWSVQEIKTLRTNYGSIDCKELADGLGRSLDAIYKKAHSLGLTSRFGIKYRCVKYGQDSPD